MYGTLLITTRFIVIIIIIIIIVIIIVIWCNHIVIQCHKDYKGRSIAK